MLNTIQEVKVAVRILRRHLRENGQEALAMSHTDALELIAQMAGHKKWTDFEATLPEGVKLAMPVVPRVAPQVLDEVRLGEVGALRTRDGKVIKGSHQHVLVTYPLNGATRNADGSLELSYSAGDATFDLDSAEPILEKGQPQYWTVDGVMVPESEVVLVPVGAIDD